MKINRSEKVRWLFLPTVLLFVGCLFSSQDKNPGKASDIPNIQDTTKIVSDKTCRDTLKIAMPETYPIQWKSIQPGLKYWPHTIDGSKFFTITTLEGPAGATTSNILDGLYEITGTYDFSTIDLTGVLDISISKSVHDRHSIGSISHVVGSSNRTGCFRLQCQISNIKGSSEVGLGPRIGIHLVKANPDTSSNLVNITLSAEVH